MKHQFSRKEFFDLMWSKPVKDIAPEFGMSDVGLAKICRSHALPLPGRGYWAKLKAGKKVVKLPLPPRGLGESETIHIGKSDWRRHEEEDARLMAEEIPPPPEFPEPIEEVIERVKKLVGKVTYVRDLNRTHGTVTRLLQEDMTRIEKRNASAYPSFSDQPHFASPYERRRLKILNSIFLAVSRLDMSSSVYGKNPSEFSIQVGNTDVRFRLDEPKQKHRREDWRSISDARRPATDPLQLSISWYGKKEEGLHLAWVDSKDAPLEESLQEIVVELIVAGELQVRAAELHSHTWRVERKTDLIEAVRKREEDVRKKERARLQRLEKARIEHLLEGAMSLRLTNDLRAYIQAVQVANKASDAPLSHEQMMDWVTWASVQVDRIDPIQKRSFLQPVEDPGAGPSESGSSSDQRDDIATTPAWHPNRWYTRLHR